MPRSRHKGRSLNGILLFDKPSGITSNSALQKVKRLFNAAKAGHTGSLDPLATGLLVICFGKATKISDYLLTADKTYIAELKLGVTTDTGDSDGAVIRQQNIPEFTNEILLNTLHNFEGEIEQIPPMYSAIKYQGKRLYKLARNGIEVARQPRVIQIFKLQLLTNKEDILKLRVHCSKGTYIRTLANDIGNKLGCGAHITTLRRVGLGPFQHGPVYTLEELKILAEDQSILDQKLLPIDSALEYWPSITLSEQDINAIHHGHTLEFANLADLTHVRVYDAKDQFYGLGTLHQDGRISLKCLS